MAFTTVTGKIGRTFYNGLGAEVVESWQQNGETFTKRWSAFFEQPHGLSEGAEVTVSGIHGDKIDPWEKDGEVRHSIKRTLNKVKVKTSKPDDAAPAHQEDDWAQPAALPEAEPWAESSVPF